jgi:virginiamycin B lyase
MSLMETDSEIRRRLGTTPHDVPAFRPNPGDVLRRASARRVRRYIGAAAAGVLVLGGVGLPLALLSGLGGSPPAPVVSPSPPSPDVRAVLGASIPIPSGAVDVAVADGTVWVSGFGKLSRLDAGTGRVVATVGTPGTEDYSQVAVGLGAVWVTADRGRLYRVDPATNRVLATIVIGGPIQGVDTGAGSVWVTRIAGEHGDLIRVDPATNQVGSVIEVGPGPGAVLYAFGALWVTNTSPPSVDRVDPSTGQVTAVRFTGLIAAGYGSLWAVSSGASPSASFVVRVDPMTEEAMATVRVPRAEAAAVGAGGVWVLAGPRSSSPTLFYPIKHTAALWEIDPSTNRLVGHPILFDALQPIAISAAAGGGAVWVADYPQSSKGGRVTRFDVVPCQDSACRA